MELRARVERAVSKRPVAWTRVERGYTLTERWVVRFADGSSAFVKGATSDDLARWIRIEHAVLEHFAGESFVAAVVGWDDDGHRPALVLEDLSAAHWPPPWTLANVDAVLATLARVAASPVPAQARPLGEAQFLGGWTKVARDPAPFLSLGLCTEGWLERTLPGLLAAQDAAKIDGDELLHMDVRSDNLCFDGDRVVLVDWNWTSVGNARMDVAAWLPSLQTEGGPEPESVLPGEGELAAVIAGYFAYASGLPALAGAPYVRPLQLAQLKAALPWALRELGMEPAW
jgi:aminoglycoside phosphotransferase (APT) family kinase protein